MKKISVNEVINQNKEFVGSLSPVEKESGVERQSRGWYEQLLDDCRTIISTRKFAIHWELIYLKWEIGDRLMQEEKRGIVKKLQQVAVDLDSSETILTFYFQLE